MADYQPNAIVQQSPAKNIALPRQKTDHLRNNIFK